MFRSRPVDERPSPPVTSDALGNPTIAWQPGEALMADRNRAVIVKRIKQLVGLPPDRFDALYGEVINNYAGYVQLLPTTDPDHLAHLGGLLDHALHLAERTLCLRRGCLLPPGQPPEIVARQADRWTYGVFLAALFHNLGRPAADLKVSLFRADGRELGVWAAGAGQMEGVDRYHVAVQPDRQADDHRRFAPFLARLLLPNEALQWLAVDLDLMSKWLSTLAGDHQHAGMLGTLVLQAKTRSDMPKPAPIPTPSNASAAPSRRPLRDILLAALRQLFETNQMSINQPRAEAWVTATDLWLVSDVGIKTIRASMIGDGVVSVPGANNGILDTLLQQEICLPNSKDQAIWSIKVGLGQHEQILTTLRIPIETIWPDPDRRPAPYQGDLVSDWKKGAGQDEQKVAAGTEMSLEFDRKPAALPAQKLKAAAPLGRLSWKEVATEFFAWLAEGIQDESLPINVQNGALWVVEEGLFLRTPSLYKRFGLAKDYDPVDVRRAVIGQDVLLMNTRSRPTELVHYREIRAGRKDHNVRGHVILDPTDVLGIDLPSVDSRIARETGPDGCF